MQTPKVFFYLISIILMTGCGLTNMASKYDTVKFTTTPPILQVHGGKVDLSLDAVFTEKYFDKKATIDFTPVLVYEGGETAFKTITIQGEEAAGGEATIFNATGGNFKYHDVLDYSEEMINSNLELRAIAKRKDEEKILGPKNIGSGVIATSTRVKNTEELANNNHGYEHETILEASATIYFLVNQANIRTTEKSDTDIRGGIYFSVPIFSFGRGSAKISSAKAKANAVKMNIDIARKVDDVRENELVNMVSSSLNTRNEYLNSYLDTKEQRKIIIDRLDVVNFSTDALVNSFIEELSLLQTLLDTEINLIHGYFMYLHQNKVLNSYVGIQP